MPRYKKGDRVVVRDDLVEDESYCMYDNSYNMNTVTYSMLEFCGKTVTINDVYSQYEIKEDMHGFGWTDEMFVGLEEEVNAMKVVHPVKEDDLLGVLGF